LTRGFDSAVVPGRVVVKVARMGQIDLAAMRVFPLGSIVHPKDCGPVVSDEPGSDGDPGKGKETITHDVSSSQLR
jgi:hypothetical protein